MAFESIFILLSLAVTALASKYDYTGKGNNNLSIGQNQFGYVNRILMEAEFKVLNEFKEHYLMEYTDETLVFRDSMYYIYIYIYIQSDPVLTNLVLTITRD